jgi:hypothetical protein
MRQPTREYQRDPPSSFTATPPSGNSDKGSRCNVPIQKPIPIDTGSHISEAGVRYVWLEEIPEPAQTFLGYRLDVSGIPAHRRAYAHDWNTS